VKCVGRRIRACVFDFDGTLAVLNIDFAAMRSAVEELVAARGIPRDAVAGRYVLEMIDSGARHLEGADGGAAAAFRREAHGLVCGVELAAAERGELLPGTREMLAALKGRGIGTAVVSRNCGAAIRRIFPDVDACCDAVIPREAAPHVKPHPEHLLAALAALHVPPADAAMVGDHPIDVRAGREAGLFTIGVLTGAPGPDKFRADPPDCILPAAADLVELLT
jgi:phosphoglycolate phosphatase